MFQPAPLAAAICAVLTAAPGLAATPLAERDEALKLMLSAAIDTDCDGSLANESVEDATFASAKTLLPGQCIVYRTDYRNTGDFAMRELEVRTPVPEIMVYIDGTAEHLSTPPGLFPAAPRTPLVLRGGDVVWPFRGGLGPGEGGRVQFRVRLDP